MEKKTIIILVGKGEKKEKGIQAHTVRRKIKPVARELKRKRNKTKWVRKVCLKRKREREAQSESKKVREASQQSVHGQEVSRRGWLTLPSHQPPTTTTTSPPCCCWERPNHNTHIHSAHLCMLAQPKIHALKHLM